MQRFLINCSKVKLNALVYTVERGRGGKHLGKQMRLLWQNHPASIFFPPFDLNCFNSGIWAMAANNLNALRVSKSIHTAVQGLDYACKDK